MGSPFPLAVQSPPEIMLRLNPSGNTTLQAAENGAVVQREPLLPVICLHILGLKKKSGCHFPIPNRGGIEAEPLAGL